MAKLWFDNRRVTKYNKIAVKRMSQTPGMIEAQRQQDDDAESVKVPFGIRALERGIEVEGVWVSPSNTPLQGSPKSAPSTPNLDTSALKNGAPTAADLPRIELPQPLYGGPYRHSARTFSRDSAYSKSRSTSPSNRSAISAQSWQRLPSSGSMPAQPGPSSLRNSISADQGGTQNLATNRNCKNSKALLARQSANLHTIRL